MGMLRVGDMTQQLRALFDLAEDPHGGFTTTCSSGSRGCDTLLRPLWASSTCVGRIHTNKIPIHDMNKST